LQLEDYALILGSTGLLIILAIVMYMTRKINWYEIETDQQDNKLEKKYSEMSKV
jgi:inner membrane protein